MLLNLWDNSYMSDRHRRSVAWCHIKEKCMNKARCLLWGNFLLFVFFIVQVITSAVLFFMEIGRAHV